MTVAADGGVVVVAGGEVPAAVTVDTAADDAARAALAAETAQAAAGAVMVLAETQAALAEQEAALTVASFAEDMRQWRGSLETQLAVLQSTVDQTAGALTAHLLDHQALTPPPLPEVPPEAIPEAPPINPAAVDESPAPATHQSRYRRI
jgi:hypothetical protein